MLETFQQAVFKRNKCLPIAGVHVDGYEEENVPTYPFQQYIQVRKTYSVEHIPVYDKRHPAASQSTESSNHHGSNHDHHAASSNTGEHGDVQESVANAYSHPRLREEISDYKKQEVYEEKGYGDSAYDHESYKIPSNEYHHSDHPVEYSSEGSSPKKSTLSRSLHTPDGSSSKILEYVAANLHDRDAQQKGVYAARSNLYCPEVIDFDLSSKKMGMGKSGNRGAKPRLQGLGSKISCLKNKYFGSEPLPRAIFAEPSESKQSVIEAPSFQNFFDMVRGGIDSSSTFQNSKMPI